MTRSQILTTRIGDQVKVEVTGDDGRTLPDYATVQSTKHYGGTWLYRLYSGGAGGGYDTERGAINAAARAIRKAAR
jgi:hypothetical protein